MPITPDDPRLTAYALGELDESERTELEALIADDPEAVHHVAEILATARLLTEQLRAETTPGLAPEQRLAIENRLETPPVAKHRRRRWAEFAVAAGLLGLAVTLLLPLKQAERARKATTLVARAGWENERRSAPRVARDIREPDEKAAPEGLPNGNSFRAIVEYSESTASPSAPAPSANQVEAESRQRGMANSASPQRVASDPFDALESFTPSQDLPQQPSQGVGQQLVADNGGFAGGGAGIGGAGGFAGASRGMDGNRGIVSHETKDSSLGRKAAPSRLGAPVAPMGPAADQRAGVGAAGSFGLALGDQPRGEPQLRAVSGTPGNSLPGSEPGKPGDESKGGLQPGLPLAQGKPGQSHPANSGNQPNPGKPGSQQQAQPGDRKAGSENRYSYQKLSTREANTKLSAEALDAAAPAPAESAKAPGAEPAALALNSRPVESSVARKKGAVDQKQKESLSETSQLSLAKSPADGEKKDKAAPEPALLIAGDASRKGISYPKSFEELQKRRQELRQEMEQVGGDAFARIVDNPFLPVEANPLSTFSIDVDTASYANVRRDLNQNSRPPLDAVRIEELINYFPYSYPAPTGPDPFSVNLEIARCPWEAAHRLVRIGLKGREVDNSKRPPSNLVFLIDVSGSMQDIDKLPLLKAGMKLLVEQLGENDRVAIVVYASSEGLVLPSTSCSQKEKVLSALEELQAGGSTNGGRGIQLAYDIAVQNFIKGGTNRVLLATDGDFNVGVTQGPELDKLIEAKRESKVFLSVLGFGQGNVKHDKLESLADKGNGQYSFIDSIKEARKVLVEQMGGTLLTIAKDVKIQVRFNARRAESYRLIGYENRMLQARDFADDKKDAGEIGAGLCVTALYEVAPTPPGQGGEDKLTGPELLNIDLRYKAPDGDISKLLSFPALDDGRDFAAASGDFKFASGVAGFGMLLRASPYAGTLTWPGLVELTSGATGPDPSGYRKEFLDLVRKAESLEPR
jgi:Ca-activated chloride channel family protein